MSKITNDGLIQSGTECFSCTPMATVGVNGLNPVIFRSSQLISKPNCGINVLVIIWRPSKVCDEEVENKSVLLIISCRSLQRLLFLLLNTSRQVVTWLYSCSSPVVCSKLSNKQLM